MIAAGVTAAAVVSAGMTFAVFVVVVAGGILVLNKSFCKESLYSFIGISHIAAVESDTSLLHSHLSASADASADKHVSLCVLEKACKSAVTSAIRAYDLFVYYFSVGDIIELELLCSAEMLEYLSVFIGNCDSHDFASFLSYLL